MQSWSAVSQLRGTAFPRKHLVIRRQHTRAHDQQPSAHCSRVARPPACSCSSCQHQCAARPWRIGLSESQSAACGPLFPTQPSRSCPAIAVRTNTAHSPPKRRPTTSTSTVERSFQRCAALLPRSSARPHPNTKVPSAACSVQRACLTALPPRKRALQVAHSQLPAIWTARLGSNQPSNMLPRPCGMPPRLHGPQLCTTTVLLHTCPPD